MKVILHVDSIRQHNFSRLWILLTAFLLCLAPIASDSLWWEICRGRAVVSNGSWQPSAELIQLEQLPDSDVLAGTLPWLVFESFDVDGLMILKFVVVALIAFLLTLQVCKLPFGSSVAAVAILLACSPAFGPDHRTLDLIFILVAWRWANAARLFALFLLTLVWCNYSIAAIWVLPTTLIALSCSQHSTKRQVVATLLVLIALCVNFRGPMAIVEMMRVAVPFVFYDRALLADSGFGPLAFTIPSIFAVGLCLTATLRSGKSYVVSAILLVCSLVGMLNAQALPYAGMIAGLAVMAWQAQAGSSLSDLKPSTLVQRILPWGAVLSMVVAVLVLIAGGISGERERLGWGVSDSLDHRLVLRDLGRYAEAPLLAHCSDTSAAGLLLFALPQAKVVDVAGLSIKRGRFHKFALLNYDLSTGRKTAYARSDGSLGGWWNSMINGNVDLLAIAPGRTRVFAALEPTLWKPLALDAPAIVLGQAGSRKFTRQIIEARNQREVVEFGGWQHSLTASVENRASTDFWQLLSGVKDSRSDIRQAAVFRSMSMLNAAARTMLPVLHGHCRPRGLAEFVRIQQELSWHEKLHCGTTSRWRATVLDSLGASFVHAGGTSLVAAPTSSTPVIQFEAEAVRLYSGGQPEEAAKLISGDGPESLFAKHCLYWQSGDISQADQFLEALRVEYPDHPLTLAAEWERGLQQQ